MKPHETHRAEAKQALDFHLITVSSSRFKLRSTGSEYQDESGELAVRMIQDAGHRVDNRILLPDLAGMIEDSVRAFLQSNAHVLVLIGGTGVSRDDITVETVKPFFEKELTGFGELLRNISYQTIGGAALLTRATAGTVQGKLVVCLPGSPGAVETAFKAFISEFPHIVSIAGGFANHDSVGHANSDRGRSGH